MGLNMILIVLYLLGAVHHTFVGIYSTVGLDFSNVTDSKLLDMKVNSFRYLTTWNLMIQTIYFYLALVIQIIQLFDTKIASRILPLAKVSKGILFSGIAFPTGIAVTTIFWILHTINIEFVLPPGYETVLPAWLNHSIHTIIIFLIIVEVLLGELYVPKYLIAFVITFIFSITYTAQYLMLHHETGRWLYGVMYHMNTTENTIFIIFITIYFLVLTFIGLLIVKRKSSKFILTEQEQRHLFCVRRCV